MVVKRSVAVTNVKVKLIKGLSYGDADLRGVVRADDPFIEVSGAKAKELVESGFFAYVDNVVPGATEPPAKETEPEERTITTKTLGKVPKSKKTGKTL